MTWSLVFLIVLAQSAAMERQPNFTSLAACERAASDIRMAVAAQSPAWKIIQPVVIAQCIEVR